MAHSVEMPELGESVTEGTVTQWLKKVGDTVTVDEPLLEVSTDKVDTEIPSPVSGVLLKILVEEDETVDVGAVIAEIGDEGEAPSSDSESTEGQSTAADTDGAADEPEQRSGGSGEESRDSAAADKASVDETPSGTSSEAASKSGSGETTDISMPELGESVSEGTITQWLKKVGDSVKVDEPLLEVSTDKVDTEVPSPVAGVLVEILAEEDDTVDVGAVIARVGEPGSTAPSTPQDTSTDGAAEDADGEVLKGAVETSTSSAQETAQSQAADEEAQSASEGEATEAAEGGSGSDREVSSAGEAAAQSADLETTEDTEDANASEAPTGSQESSDQSSETGAEESKPYVTPLVRKLADKHGVDLRTVKGTGIGGRIRKQDVIAAAEGAGSATGASSEAAEDAQISEKATPAPAGPRASTKKVDPAKQELRGKTLKVNRIRQITAKTTLESLHGAAQLTQLHEVDMTRVADLRSRSKKAFADKHGVNLTYLPFFAKAVVEALVSHPNVNASYNAETKEMTYHGQVNLGIAVDTEQGLLSPVIHNAQDMTLPELAQAIADLAQRARTKKLTPKDITGGTFTITNIGSEGALSDTPILVPPQAGIMGTGAIVKRPVVLTEDGADAIAIRHMALLPLTYDHQVFDGADAGRFMTTVRDRLETADFEADLEL